MFISREKQEHSRTAERLRIGMRVVLVIVIVLAICGAGLLAAFYLVPYFHEEMKITPTGSQTTSLFSSEDIPVYDDLGLPVYSDTFNLFVINQDNPAEESFAPQTQEVAGALVDQRIAEATRLMISAAKGEGLELSFSQGYVSYQEQQTLHAKKVEELQAQEGLTTVMAKTKAKETVPQQGQSDFQSGLCLTVSGNQETFASSKTYSWLKSNMGKYGFVFRFPQDKTDFTGSAANPLVIRYVGREHAMAMQQRSMCLEEYLAYLKRQG